MSASKEVLKDVLALEKLFLRDAEENLKHAKEHLVRCQNWVKATEQKLALIK